MTVQQIQEAPVDQLLYSLAQTAKRLNIGVTTVYKEIASGDLETLRIGDRQFTTDEMQRRYIARKSGRAA